jgi:hypothetical protein
VGSAGCVVSANDYEDSRNEYKLNWRTLDEVLYRLCRDHPHHADSAAVNAKLYIIGRTYATGIERRFPTSGAQGSSMSQLSAFFAAYHLDIDRWFGRLAAISEPLTVLSIRKILLVHGLLVSRLREVTRGEQTARSFVSKYLHFHNPAVPFTTAWLPDCFRAWSRFEPVGISRFGGRGVPIRITPITCGASPSCISRLPRKVCL